jgi:RNA polymerase sigma-70 factor, ECF subfamily
MQLQAIAVSRFGPRIRAAAAPLRRVKAMRVHEQVEIDDVALMAGVAAGDRAAFAALFARYAPRVKSYLMRLGAPGAGAEDLAQDALINVWRRAARFDAERAAVSTWIFVIARNAWIDRLRREKVELAYRNGMDEPFETEAAPDEAVERGQTVAQIRAALAVLSAEQKQVVQLAFFEDKPHSEIAEVLALPLGTVKSRLRLALTKLRAHWEQHS